jgi:hypothetical protein
MISVASRDVQSFCHEQKEDAYGPALMLATYSRKMRRMIFA